RGGLPEPLGLDLEAHLLDVVPERLAELRGVARSLAAGGVRGGAVPGVRLERDPQPPRRGPHLGEGGGQRRVGGGGGPRGGALAPGPCVASRRAALSRTERDTACCTLMPLQPSPTSGPIGVRPRVGFRPNTPQQDAGTRIEPPPSVACAAGTMPAATAAAAPP